MLADWFVGSDLHISFQYRASTGGRSGRTHYYSGIGERNTVGPLYFFKSQSSRAALSIVSGGTCFGGKFACV